VGPQYEKLVPDYNFGTILRGDAKREYDEDNSILVTRTQFYAIEVSGITYYDGVSLEILRLGSLVFTLSDRTKPKGSQRRS